MLQKQRKFGEPTTPDKDTVGGGAAALAAAKSGRSALSQMDKAAADARRQIEVQEAERRRRTVSVRSCSC